MSFIKQITRPGLFTSDMIAGRYQVMESDIFKGSYFIYDHTKDDILRGRDSSTIYFDDVDQAMAEVSNDEVKVTRIAKAPKAPKAPKAAKVAKDPVVKETKVAKAPKAPTEKRVSVHGTIVELIKTTELTDEEISAKIMADFPEAKTARVIDVRYRRRKIAAGEI
jgi:uncharacterized protein YdeI (BOF family)